MNPNFLAIPMVLVLAFTVWEIFNQAGFTKANFLRSTIVLFCSIVLILLTSRMATFALLFSMISLGIYVLRKYRSYRPLLTLVALFTILLVVISQTHAGGVRLRNIVKHFDAMIDNPMKINRVQTMDAGLDLIANNVMFGVGFKDLQEKLNKVYVSKNYDYPLKQEYHIHNQFIQIGAVGGVFLFSLFVIFLWLPVICHFHIFGFMQSSIFTLVFLTDSPLIDYRIAIIFLLSIGVMWWSTFVNKNKTINL